MIQISRTTVSWVALLAMLALLALALGCTAREKPAPGDAERSTVTVREAEPFSVYDLEGAWHDQTGAARSLASWRGRPVLLAMIYTHCTATCPLAVSELKRIAAGHADVRFVLVSLDPVRDDARRLAAYASERGLDPQRWTLLTGSDTDVRDLAATLGVRYRQVTPDDLAHSNLITLLDREGRISRQTSGRMDDAALAMLPAVTR
jgi:protein SCO1